MGSIFELPSAWRASLMPASFRGAPFHVESASKENARRIVTHEFPKKEIPYSEDMGRHAIQFTVRGYCIQYPIDATANILYRRDYRIARDALLGQLEREGPGVLQLPLLPPMIVVCPRYRLTEEEKLGGYCVFDMQFVERGTSPVETLTSPRTTLIESADRLTLRTIETVSPPGSPALSITDILSARGRGNPFLARTLELLGGR